MRRVALDSPRFVPTGVSWALDLAFIASPYGLTFTVPGILDEGSRKLLRLKVLPTKCALVVLGHLLIAIGHHGLPAALRTDNEAMFTSRVWRAALRALGAAHRRAPPCQPWRNGRIERLFGTLKAALQDFGFTSAGLLQRALVGFTHSYNALRPHQGLGGLTPEEAWSGLTMAQVQQRHAEGEDHWVANGLKGLFVGGSAHARCRRC